MDFSKYPKIGQFKDSVTNLYRRACFNGLDDSGEPIYDFEREISPVTFRGTVKVHGTNAGFGFCGDSFWLQKRKSKVSVGDDNYGFASRYSNQECQDRLKSLADTIRSDYDIPKDVTLILYGEWAGKGIQQSVAVSELPKKFYLFGIKTKIGDGEEAEVSWYPIKDYSAEDIDVYNIEKFGVFEVSIDLKCPKKVQSKILEITDAVEKECPVGKYFGVSGVGEGVVWQSEGFTARFKVKGDKHSVVKTKSKKDKASIDPVKLNSISEFADYTVTENRIDQCLSELFQDKPFSKKETGKVIKWMLSDILEEESEALSNAGLTAKDVSGEISKRSRLLFFNKIDNF